MTTELTKGAMAKWRLPELLHSLSAWVGPSRAEAGAERPPEGRTEGSLHLVERPVDRSVLWLPGGWGEQGTGRPYPYELFVEPEVLQDVEAHALEEIEGSYGLLTGRLLACNETRVPFVSVEASHRSDSPMPVGEDLTSFREFFWKVGEVAGRRGRVLVGWYHTHSLLGLQLSERDRQVHVAHFQDEWPCALVVVTRRGASEGGFFQRDRGDILFRRSTRPFRELVSQRVEPGGGPYVTSLAWANYWTHEPVLYARKPGDLPSKGGKWSWRQRPRGRPRSDKTLADLAARISEGPAGEDSGADLSGADLSGADGQRPTTAAQAGAGERRESAELTYERAMGRPAREGGVTGSARPIPAGPPPKEAWDEWKRALGVRREREGEVRKVEAEQAAVDAARADADADARAKAALAARTAAEAAARAAAEALGIGSEGEAIAAEAVSKAEADAEALVEEIQAAELAAKKKKKKGTPKKAAPAAKKGKAKATEPEVEEPVDVLAAAPESDAAAPESDEERAVAESDEEAAAAVVESEGPSEAELVSGEAEGTEVEVPEPAVELEPDPEPAADVEEEIFALEVTAEEPQPDRAEETATPAEESRAGETPKELAKQAEVVARSSLQLTGDGEMVVPPLVLPDPPPRAKLRRYAVWVGIGLPLAAALAWILLG